MNASRLAPQPSYRLAVAASAYRRAPASPRLAGKVASSVILSDGPRPLTLFHTLTSRGLVSRRTAERSALSPRPSILETVAELAERLGRSEPLDDRIDAAVALLRDALALDGCLVRVRLASGAAHGAARGVVPDECDEVREPARCLTIPLASDGRFTGALVVAPPPRESDGRAMLALAANLLVAMLRAEGRAEASAAEVDAQRRLVARVVDADANGLKTLATAVCAAGGFVVVLVSAASPSLVVVARSSNVTLSAQQLVAALVAQFGGRGGGRPELAQAGGLVGPPDAIVARAKELVL